MAFEIIQKRNRGAQTRSGEWGRVPCVAIVKGGMSFNHAAVEFYSLRDGGGVDIMVDREARIVAIKPLTAGDGCPNPHRLRSGGHKDTVSKTLTMCCKEIPRMFPDAVGRFYRLQMNPGLKIIQAELSPANEGKKL